jgi:hypothetical protein
LDYYDIGTYEILARSEGTATTSTNVAGVCATKLCYFCGGAKCIGQCSCTWRGRVYSWVYHSKWSWVGHLCGQLLGWHLCKMWQHWRMLGECSTRCHLKMHGHLDHRDIGTYKMLARSEGTATISTNAIGVCATKLCYFCGGFGCMESVQQDAILRSGHLDHHTWRMCHEAWAW